MAEVGKKMDNHTAVSLILAEAGTDKEAAATALQAFLAEHQAMSDPEKKWIKDVAAEAGITV